MAAPDTSLDDLFRWAATSSKSAAAKAAEAQGVVEAKTPEQNGRGAEDDKLVGQIVPTNVESVSVPGSMPSAPNFQMFVGTDKPDLTVETLRLTTQKGGEKIASDARLAAIDTQLAQLDALIEKAAGAAQPASAAPAPATPSAADSLDVVLGFATKEAADKAAADVVGRWQKAAADQADSVAAYMSGVAFADALLQKWADDGTLAAMGGGGMPPPDAAGGPPPGPPPGPAGGMPPPDAGGPPPGPGGPGGPGGAPSPDEIVEQTLAGLMEATGMSPQQLKALVEDKLAQLGGGAGGPPTDGGGEAPPSGGDKPEKSEPDGDEAKEARVKLAKALPVLNELIAKSHDDLLGRRRPSKSASEAGKAQRAVAKEYFTDLQRMCA